jgi:nitroreductase
MPIGEAMFTQRAIRRLDPDRPVSDDRIRLILDAGSKAPTGGNAQPVRTLVAKDPDLIRRLGDLYHDAWWAKRADELGWTPSQEIPANSPYRPAARLASEFGSVPAVLLVFSLGASDFSVYPAVQNMLLAARALGIGSVLTTLHPQVMDRVNRLFNVPEETKFHCCVPLGYPRGNFGTTQRLPTRATTYWNRWGDPPPW